jgi:Holliday junction resolvase YEN1
MYRSSAIIKQWTDRENTNLKTEEDCRMAMVWIALLGGGDYAPEGLTGFGESINLNYFWGHAILCTGMRFRVVVHE